MSHDLSKSCSFGGFRDEHPKEKVSSRVGDVGGELEGGVEDVLVEEVDVVSVWVGWIVVEGEVARKHGVENHTATPDVDGRSDVGSIGDDQLGSSVARRSTRGSHEVVLRRLEGVGESEIGDDDVPSLVEEEVLELEISVDDVLGVEVVDSRDELSEELGGGVLLEVSMSEDVVEELST